MLRKALFFVGVALMFIPVLAFAGNGSTNAPSILTLVSGVFGAGLLGSIGIIFKLRVLVNPLLINWFMGLVGLYLVWKI